jgi:hypothetical protein
MDIYESFRNKLVIINLRTGEFVKGILLDKDEKFLKLKTLKSIKLVSIADIVDLREVLK